MQRLLLRTPIHTLLLNDLIRTSQNELGSVTLLQLGMSTASFTAIHHTFHRYIELILQAKARRSDSLQTVQIYRIQSTTQSKLRISNVQSYLSRCPESALKPRSIDFNFGRSSSLRNHNAYLSLPYEETRRTHWNPFEALPSWGNLSKRSEERRIPRRINDW